MILHDTIEKRISILQKRYEILISDSDANEDAAIIAILKDQKGSTMHCIAIYKGLIYDGNATKKLEFNKEALDWCCSGVNEVVKFSSFHVKIFASGKELKKRQGGNRVGFKMAKILKNARENRKNEDCM